MGEGVEGARSFAAGGDDYDRFMGRYSRALAPLFLDAAGVGAGMTALDVGCGPGALTAELVARLGADHVLAVDPSPSFVAACARRNPGVTVREGRAEALPVDDGVADAVLSQLVLHFVSDAAAAASEFRRVLRPGGIAAACVWDFHDGMQMLRAFWDAALELGPDAPDEARVLRFGRPDELAGLFREAGFVTVTQTTLQVSSEYASFEELWETLLLGIGPVGAYTVALDDEARARLRECLHRRLGAPTGAFTLSAVARCAVGHRPEG